MSFIRLSYYKFQHQSYEVNEIEACHLLDSRKNTSYLMRVYIKKPLLIEFMPDGYIRYNISLNRNMF